MYRSIPTLLLLCWLNMTAQIPTGYYDPAIGKSGTALRIALHDIIDDHTSISYSGIWAAVSSTDNKGDDMLWDIYSDLPGGMAPYEYNIGSDQCGSAFPATENGCYNREHTWPKSKFHENYPMYTDLWIVYPTDAFVNNKRADYPYGEVSAPGWTSMNGSRLGPNSFPGAPGSVAFEPIDSFKGDIARSYFYISTRYYSEDGGWDNWDMATGADLKPWTKEMLLQWHHLDPVSEKEIVRNEAIYAIQHNRNPFIDHPEMADCIFGTEDCTGLLSSATKNILPDIGRLYPNPANEKVHLVIGSGLKGVSYILKDVTGKTFYREQIQEGPQVLTIDTRNCPSGVYYIQIIADNRNGCFKFVKK